jgi:hypothetical protein
LSLNETERLRSSLRSKIELQDKLEIDNLEMHLMLDAKLRALESVLRCGSDASTLFKYDRKERREFSMQTELNIEEIYMKENQNEVVSKEL